LLGEVELHFGVAALEQRDRRRKQRRARARERGQAHAAAADPGDRLELGLGGGKPGDHNIGVLHKRPSRVREPDAAAAAVHERGAGPLLESGDLLRNGGLRVGERVGR
jgi:hypothetical protein